MERFKSIDEIVAELNSASARKSLPQLGVKNTFSPLQSNEIRDVRNQVPLSTIMDRTSDGGWIPKFENYITAYGNEDRLAKQQSFGEKALHGVEKFVGKTVTNALDATVGTVWGLVEGAYKGNVHNIWDNSFSNTMDDWNKQMNYALPNYYSNEEKSKNFIQKLGTSNFWFNEVGEGLAFVAGALLPEIALGSLTGGATIAGGLAKTGARGLAGRAAKEMADITASRVARQATGNKVIDFSNKISNKIADVTNYRKGADIIRSYNRAIWGQGAGDIISTGAFLVRTSNFEAGMEARHNFHDAVDNYYSTFQEKNGRMPTAEEANTFINDARRAANWVYAANGAILGVSNAAQFAKAFGYKVPSLSETKFGNFANRAIGLSYKTLEDGTKVMREAGRGQKIAGALYTTFRKPVIEGAYEEAFQGIVGTTMQNYLSKKYSSDNLYAFNLMGELSQAFSEQYGTKEGWNEIGTGMVIGLLGGVFSKGGIKKLGQDVTFSGRSLRQAEIQESLTRSNEGLKIFKGMDRASASRTFRNLSMNEESTATVSANENTIANIEFIKSQEHLKSRKTIQKDFDSIIDNMTLDDTGLDALEQQDLDIDSYKSNLKEEFAQNMKDYRFARRTVDALNIDARIPESVGNKELIREALIMNIALGKSAEISAKKIANQISGLIQPVTDNISQGGIFDYLSFYNNLSETQKQKAEEVQTKKNQISQVREQAVKNREQLAKVQTERTQRLKDKTLEKRYNALAEKALLLQQQEVKLNDEISQISSALETDFRNSNYNIDGSQKAGTINPLSAIEELNKIDDYVNSLRQVGNDYQADSIEYMLDQFRRFADHGSEMSSMYSRMMATNFFEGSEGKGLVGRILGSKYNPTPEFMEAVRDSSEIIDRQMRLAGYRGQLTTEEIISQALEQNEELSEREKFRLESLIRLSLTSQRNKIVANEIVEINSEIASEKESQDPLVGDTVLLKTKIDFKNREISNIEELDKVIDSILQEIDQVRGDSPVRKQRIAELESQIAELEKQKEEFSMSELSSLEVTDLAGNIFEATPEEIITYQTEVGPVSYIIDEDGNMVMLKVSETISDKQFQAFINKGTVAKGTIKSIAKKVKGGESLTPREFAIFSEKTAEIETELRADFEKNSSAKDIDAQIQPIMAELEELKADTEKVATTEDYLRYVELVAKKENEGLTDTEVEEYSLLEEDLNSWLLLSGVVVEGVRLSDLIRQREVIANEEILPIESVGVASITETLEEVNFTDGKTRTDFSSGQTYDRVFATTTSRGTSGGETVVKISNITAKGFSEQLPENFDLKYTLDPNDGTIILTIEEAQRINSETSIRIFPGESTFISNYAAVVVMEPQMDGTVVGTALRTDFTKENEEFSEDQNTEAIYDSSPGQEVLIEIDPEDKYNKTLIAEYQKVIKSKRSTPDKIEAAKEKLRKGLVLKTRLGEDFVAVLKSKRGETMSENTAKFYAFRDQVVDDYIAEIGVATALTPMTVTTSASITVQRILPGRPNFLYSQSGSETTLISKRISEVDAAKILDIGYVENGKLQTKNRVEGVDTTFINKAISKPKKEKTPFVVMQKGQKIFAYPVSLLESGKPNTKELEDVFNSKEVADVDKVVKLNKILASFGIDIQTPGNAFIAAGKTNLTREFLDAKIAQAENISYFSPIDEWTKKSTDMQSVITGQMLINLNMSDPLHSPKLQLNFDAVFENIDVSGVVTAPKRKGRKPTKPTAAEVLEKMKKCGK